MTKSSKETSQTAKPKKIQKHKTQITLFLFFNNHIISLFIAKVFACFCNCLLKTILLSIFI